MEETVTDRALTAAIEAARNVIDTELGEGIPVAFILTMSAAVAEPNGSVLVAAANNAEHNIDLGRVFTGLVVLAVEGGRRAGANVAALPIEPPSSN